MNIKTIRIPSLVLCSAIALLFAGCGPSENSGPQVTSAGASVANAEGVITITGNDRMEFSVTAFTVEAGSEVTLVFDNVGRMPKASMGHNLVVLDKSVDAIAFANAAARHAQNEYIAPDYEDRVLAATKILGPGESETLTFTAPDEQGDYPFVCSFPGHTPAGMRGLMTVE